MGMPFHYCRMSISLERVAFYGNIFNRRVSTFQERLREFYGNAFYRRVSMFQERLKAFYGYAFYRRVCVFQ